MKNIGGEIEYTNEPEHGLSQYLTDSGRSSLRLMLRSEPFADMNFLLPDFLCGTIFDVFRSEDANFSFYTVNKDLSINWETVEAQEYDAIYVVDYFGIRHDLSSVEPDKFVVEDCVFLPKVENVSGIKNWVGFNSFRKISAAADGSLLKSTIPLNNALVQTRPARFVEEKMRAKRIKLEYIYKKTHSESEYLSLFKKGEAELEIQTDIFSASSESMPVILDFCSSFEDECAIRRRNYEALSRLLKISVIPIQTDFYSFCVLDIDARNSLREYLSSRKIFLPVHWPRPDEALDNPLYDRLISIPLDSRFNEEDMARVANSINSFYKLEK